MKALSVQQPFASAIATGEKWTEFRSWATRYRGDLLICAGRTPSRDEGLTAAECRKQGLPLGVALCIVELSDCRDLDDGFFGWVLDKRRDLDAPFPVKGKLGLFDVALPKGCTFKRVVRNPHPNRAD